MTVDAGTASAREEEVPRPRFWVGLGRALAGALIFSAPILMTMEMWTLGPGMEPVRLALLLALMVPVLIRLHRFGGFRMAPRLRDRVVDALVAILVAAVAATIMLSIFGVIGLGMPVHEIVCKIALQIVPGSLGASLARAQLGPQSPLDDADTPQPGYVGELFLMVVGALFLSVNIAPTEEVVLIAHKMGVWQQIVLVFVTLGLMHAFVYEFEFRGAHGPEPGAGLAGIFFRYAVVGYLLVMAVNLYMIWTFGHIAGMAPPSIVATVVVLSFPAALGAAVARLIL